MCVWIRERVHVGVHVRMRVRVNAKYKGESGGEIEDVHFAHSPL